MYVVAGLTGQTGSRIADLLLERGVSVRGLVRDCNRAMRWKQRGVELVEVDFGDESALTDALRGAHGAYLLSPPNLGRDEALVLAKSMQEAVLRSKVSTLVFLSSVGAQYRIGTGAALASYDAERLLCSVANSTIFLRAVSFMENFLPAVMYAEREGILPSMYLDIDLPRDFVSVRDIGQVAVQHLVAPSEGAKAIELIGPRKYSIRDVSTLIGRLVRKDVTVKVIPREHWVSTLTSRGLRPEYASLVSELFDWYNRGTPTPEVDEVGVESLTVRGSTSFEDVLLDASVR